MFQLLENQTNSFLGNHCKFKGNFRKCVDGISCNFDTVITRKMHYYETKNHIISIGGNVFLVSCEEGLVPVAENTSDNEQNDKYRDDEDTSDDDQDLT